MSPHRARGGRQTAQSRAIPAVAGRAVPRPSIFDYRRNRLDWSSGECRHNWRPRIFRKIGLCVMLNTVLRKLIWMRLMRLSEPLTDRLAGGLNLPSRSREIGPVPLATRTRTLLLDFLQISLAGFTIGVPLLLLVHWMAPEQPDNDFAMVVIWTITMSVMALPFLLGCGISATAAIMASRARKRGMPNPRLEVTATRTVTLSYAIADARERVMAVLPLLEAPARPLPDGQSGMEVWATNQVPVKLGAVDVHLDAHLCCRLTPAADGGTEVLIYVRPCLDRTLFDSKDGEINSVADELAELLAPSSAEVMV